MVKRTPLEETVLSRIRPTGEEREHICGVARRLLDAISASGQVEGMVVGSIARNTWVSGEHDIDIFLLFSPLRAILQQESAHRVFCLKNAPNQEGDSLW